MTPYRVGIDLGTTNTVCAVIAEGDSEPTVIKLTHQDKDFTVSGRSRDNLLPSAVCVGEDGRVYVGEIARTLQRFAHAETFVSTKRHMGTDWRRSINGYEWTPEKVAGCILKLVRQELRTRFFRDPEVVVITVPASFGPEARRSTLRAAKLAGFSSERVLLFDEPTAALLDALLSDRTYHVSERESTHMVVDIGGGTLDVSLLKMRADKQRLLFDVVGRSRFNELAGDDFDLSIAGLLLHRWEQHFNVSFSDYDNERRASKEQKSLCGTLLGHARTLKSALAQQMNERHRREWPQLREQVLPFETPAGTWSYEFTGQDLLVALLEYFKDVRDVDERTEEFSFFRAIYQCLKSASEILRHPIEVEDLDQVWLAGGSSQLPVVQEAIQRMTHNRPRLIPNCMEAIARGAARYARIMTSEDIQITERMFDGIYLQSSDQRFLCLVAPQDKTPTEFSYPNLLRLPVAGNRLIVNTFSGHTVEVSSGHSMLTLPNLTPLAQRSVKFPVILPAGQAVSVRGQVSRNRDIELEFIAHYKGEDVVGRVAIIISDDQEDFDDEFGDLPDLN